jgi:hypothetical protein
MNRTSSIWLLAASVSLACATSPAATPNRPTPTPSTTQAAPPPSTSVAPSSALNPVGTFDFTAIGPDGSTASAGHFTITGTPGNYKGRVEREGMGGTDLTSVTVDGQTMRLVASIPEGAVTLTLNFAAGGNDFTGRWNIENLEGSISGKRR